MIALSWNSDAFPTSIEADPHIKELMSRFRGLPRHIARKHLGAAMRKALRPGIPVLRKLTPPLGTRRGRRKKGEKRRSTGNLRRAVTVRVGQTGRNNDWDAFVWGVVGYRAGIESRKAIWLNYGTDNGVRAQFMVENFLKQYHGRVATVLAANLAEAIEKAAAEIAGGRNPTRAYQAGGTWTAGG